MNSLTTPPENHALRNDILKMVPFAFFQLCHELRHELVFYDLQGRPRPTGEEVEHRGQLTCGQVLPKCLGGGPATLSLVAECLGAVLGRLTADPTQEALRQELVLYGAEWIVRTAFGPGYAPSLSQRRRIRRRLVEETGHHLPDVKAREAMRQRIRRAFAIFRVDELLGSSAARLLPSWRLELARLSDAALGALAARLSSFGDEPTWAKVREMVDEIETTIPPVPKRPRSKPPLGAWSAIVEYFAAFGRRVALVLLPVEIDRTEVYGRREPPAPTGLAELLRGAGESMANVVEWCRGLPIRADRWVRRLMMAQGVEVGT